MSTPTASETLLEREQELQSIRELLDRTREGKGGVALVEGPAGVGKTSLLAAAASEARKRKMEVAWASGSEFGRDMPFAVCLGLFERRLAAAPHDEREELLAGSAGEGWAALRPGVAPLAPAGAADRLFPILHGLLWLTSNLAEGSGLLVAVDDLHWSDRPSLRFLVYLTHHLVELPVAVVGALRPAEPDTPEDLVTSLRGHAQARRLAPEPLSEEAVWTLVRERIPAASGDLCRQCARVTAGNPFLVSELLGELESKGAADRSSHTPLEELVPASVQDAAARRLSRLGEDAAALARAVAVLGDEAELRHAARLANLDREQAARAADTLVATMILRDGERYGFVHPLVRASVRSGIPSAELARRHRQVAELLAEEDARAEQVAEHLLRADRRAEPWAVDELRTAASRALAEGAPESAVGFLRRALEEPPETELRPRVLLELAEAEDRAGQPDAPKTVEAALELLDEPVERAGALHRLGVILHQRSHLDEAADAFARGIRIVDEHGLQAADLAKDLRAAYIASAVPAGRHEEALRWARDLTTGERRPATSGERKVVSEVAMAQVFMVSTQGACPEMTRYAEWVLDDGGLLAAEGPASPSVWNAAGLLYYCDELDPSERATEAALAEARRLRDFLSTAWWLAGRALIRYARGRVGEGVADAQAAFDASQAAWRARCAESLPAMMAALAVGLIERGELAAAGRVLELPDAPEWQPTFPVLLRAWARARLDVARGETSAGLAGLREVGKLAVTRLGLHNPAVLPWRSDAAVAARMVGEHDEAGRLADEELELARRLGVRRSVGVALRARGLVEGGSSGIERLREAVEVLELSPSRLELCRALVGLGAALRRDGRRAEARAPLRRGLEMAHRFGALALADEGERELKASGARPRRSAARGPDALTPGERRVAELAAEGVTNRAIAQSLFVTVKAVEWHLRNVYSKLDIASREELSDALEPDAT